MSKETKPSEESRGDANCASAESTKSKEENPGKNTYYDDFDFDFMSPPIDPKEIGKTVHFRRR